MESDSEREKVRSSCMQRKYEVNPVNVKWKREEDGLPIVDQYSHLGVEMSKYCSWDALLLGCTHT